MYFKNVILFDLEKNINNLDNIYAHSKDNDKEKLKCHMDLTYKYLIKLIEKKNIDNIFKNIENIFLKDKCEDTIKLWKELFCNSIYLHDIGKINANFQFLKMKNDYYKDIKQKNSKHSMLSSVIYFTYYFEKIMKLKGSKKEVDLNLLLTFLGINTFLMSKHHGSLDVFLGNEDNFKEKFINGYKYYLKEYELSIDYKKTLSLDPKNINIYFKIISKTLKDIEDNEKWSSIDMYIYSKLLFSLLVTTDHYATSEYMSGKEIQNFGIISDYKEFFDIYKEGEIYITIQKYKQYTEGKGKNPFEKNNINLLRTEIFLEAEKNLLKNKNKNMFYLEAPTGSGKTNVSINLAFNLLKENKDTNKIFYVFPFNTLVEQTKDSLDKIFESNENMKNQISVLNSTTPIKTEDLEEDNTSINIENSFYKVDYEKSLLNRQFVHYPIVLTTHVNFFNYLFGNSREAIFALTHIANSVVILDEIQSYRNHIWKEIILFLNKYSEILNIKIIVMSATLPRLGKFLENKDSFVELIENRSKYYNNPLFKQRVEVDYSLLIKDMEEEHLIEKVIEVCKDNDKNIVVEVIRKKRASSIYDAFIEKYQGSNREILLLTGDDNKAERKKIIREVKEKKNILLVSTQVIEAGVDIDMDIGFKNISILDSEEQFMGRINRSCKKKGSKVYFFYLDEASTIYKNDFRKSKEFTLQNEEIRRKLDHKEFEDYYNTIMKCIADGLEEYNDRNINEFRDNMLVKLNYKEITQRMRLIDDDRKKYTVFLNRNIELEDNQILNGKDIWNKYVNLLEDKDLGYAERRIKISGILEKVDYFTYDVYRMDKTHMGDIGGMYYIEDGEKYFTNDKFDREKFEGMETYEMI